MNNYYNELSQLSILEQEINRFATSLQNKKAGCFTHRFEALLNVLPNEFRNQVNFRNKIQDYIKKSNYEKDVKDYVLQVFLSFFEPIEIKVPNSLRNVVEKNESYNKAMIEGYNNFKSANNYTQSQEPHKEALPPQPIVKQKPEQETPKTFDELFYNTDLVKPCIDILKELDPPLIDTDYNFIGKLKGIVCVWIDELQRQGIVKHYSDRKIFASLIPQKIKRFSIDESMFGKYQSKAEKNYRTDIKTMVSKIKLSHNSQNSH